MTWRFFRFQVNKRVEYALQRYHPWIYRRQCSSALDAIPLGSILRIVGTANQFLGLGLYDPMSAIAIRVFSWEDLEPDIAYFKSKFLKAYERRKKFLSYYKTNAFRWVHGEADGLPGLSIDVYHSIGVARLYLLSWKEYLEQAMGEAAKELGLKKLYLRPKRGQTVSEDGLIELLSGRIEAVPEPVSFGEAGQVYFAYPMTGLKSGFFLDLRELRLFLKTAVKPGFSVLNLFANDGVFSALASLYGAEEVISVERRAGGESHAHALFQEWGIAFDPNAWIVEDVWKYLERQAAAPCYDLAIIDPPSLASSARHLQNALGSWQRLHADTLRLLKTPSHFLSISCSERVNESMQITWTARAAKEVGRKIELVARLPGNFDHPELKQLPERNYFRALYWKVMS